ncbi:hypothetical protein MTO96_009827 [Rhipicephalus appendiculatus]
MPRPIAEPLIYYVDASIDFLLTLSFPANDVSVVVLWSSARWSPVVFRRHWVAVVSRGPQLCSTKTCPGDQLVIDALAQRRSCGSLATEKRERKERIAKSHKLRRCDRAVCRL